MNPISDHPTPGPAPLSTPDPDEVSEAVARARRGEPDGWRFLTETYGRRVFAMIKSRVRDAHTAEEMTQSVFLKVIEEFKRGRYREQGRFEPWLFRIAMNLVRDRARRVAVRGPSLSYDDHTTTSPNTDAAPSEDIDRLREALDDLPDADREIIQLRHHAGLSFKSIAEMLAQPVGTLLARHHRALAKLRERLSPADPTTTDNAMHPARELA